jgi:hypothetical protein
MNAGRLKAQGPQTATGANATLPLDEYNFCSLLFADEVAMAAGSAVARGLENGGS